MAPTSPSFVLAPGGRCRSKDKKDTVLPLCVRNRTRRAHVREYQCALTHSHTHSRCDRYAIQSPDSKLQHRIFVAAWIVSVTSCRIRAVKGDRAHYHNSLSLVYQALHLYSDRFGGIRVTRPNSATLLDIARWNLRSRPLRIDVTSHFVPWIPNEIWWNEMRYT